jgi:hypothetical protein
VSEPVDERDLGSRAFGRRGSSPLFPTTEGIVAAGARAHLKVLGYMTTGERTDALVHRGA